MSWYLVITEEMRAWGLAGNELLVFALINGYSQTEQGCYWGSLALTAEVCGISRNTARNCLNALAEKGFIRKDKAVVNGEFRVIYVAMLPSDCTGIQNLDGGTNSVRGGVQNLCEGGTNFDPNNKSIINIYNKESNTTRTRETFNFLSSLIALGVDRQVAEDWMAVRKAKGLTNTQTAFDAIAKEIAATPAAPSDCIALAVKKNWGGYESAWYLRAIAEQKQGGQPYKTAAERENDEWVRQGIELGIFPAKR